MSGAPVRVDDAWLRAHPLPMPRPDDDKEGRGRVLVVAGSVEMPGAALLSAIGALRAGAGKLSIATASSVAAGVAIAMPEARVVGWPETPSGGPAAHAAHALQALAARADAVVVGPGMLDDAAVAAFVEALVPGLGDGTVLVLDAAALAALPRLAAAPARRRTILATPHAGEAAKLLGAERETIAADPHAAALEAARRFGATVAVKGARTAIAAPDGRAWLHEGGHVGLATSGSGDVLAGVVGGLAARGAPPERALAWGVALHARAGLRLAARLGPLGALAREIPDEIPGLVDDEGRLAG
ncbi:MAG TPA: NAD(P)H-hydrate dehydratase [Burkholderiaceae bacterium]|nr:NAD(P)H-hydrate dehydratase [Burkholderiaceae bacterium]